jgi:hypothetical protein
MRDMKPKPDGAAASLQAAPSPPRKKYEAPRLVEYGDLRRIVMAKKGTANDGRNVPATKR